mmetsp:Transcript_2077/g.5852  ORF Transcript_2077/g.5852 Transcript_2077/m.5852 type:complete len:285 (-) Transcript_2077:541-1395(-)
MPEVRGPGGMDVVAGRDSDAGASAVHLPCCPACAAIDPPRAVSSSGSGSDTALGQPSVISFAKERILGPRAHHGFIVGRGVGEVEGRSSRASTNSCDVMDSAADKRCCLSAALPVMPTGPRLDRLTLRDGDGDHEEEEDEEDRAREGDRWTRGDHDPLPLLACGLDAQSCGGIGSSPTPPYLSGSASSPMASQRTEGKRLPGKCHLAAVAGGIRVLSTRQAGATTIGAFTTKTRAPVSGNMTKLSRVSKVPRYSFIVGETAWWMSSLMPIASRSTTTVCRTRRP